MTGAVQQSRRRRESAGIELRVRGLVQGVGLRPTVWRIARELGLVGSVRNDGDGVLVRAWGSPASLSCFVDRLLADRPPLARIDEIERNDMIAPCDCAEFRIVPSESTSVHTGIVPDAATCEACGAEIADPGNRRYRYPFTNCTHCGPRLSIVEGIPYDRHNTSMAAFPMCPDCAREYADPMDRRFHAQPNACPVCGPRVWLVDPAGRTIAPHTLGALDAIDAADRLLEQGRIVAVKGIGGFHLACDATNAAAVDELRRRKRRWQKPFALMARDLAVIAGYCRVLPSESALLRSPAAPVVLLALHDAAAAAPRLARGVAPGQATLGFMLPYSPLHRLLLQRWSRPLVMTSGNRSDEPQCIDNDDALARLGPLADALLLHDRAIVNRVDDSVVRVMDGAPRPLRRARGYAPAPLRLPEGFAGAPPLLALGGELKSTVCLLQDGQAILSQHLGDLQDARAAAEFDRTLALYQRLFQHRAGVVAVDLHPNYHASQYGRALASEAQIPLIEVQHHRAHIGAVLADNGFPIDPNRRVVGVALDGSGYGDDGTIWGGEWLVGNYHGLERVGRLRRVALPGGARAILEPWRSLYAQIIETMGWDAFLARFDRLAAARQLRARPIALLDRMIERGVNSPRTSSCGRLFDAVAAALGICPDRVDYEGQAAIELETLGRDVRPDGGYPFDIVDGDDGVRVLDPAPMWWQLFADLAAGAPRAQIAARFHRGLADAVVELTARVAGPRGISTVALSGGVLQNRTLLEQVAAGLRARGLEVLAHRRVPCNDGGLALGQAVVGAVRIMGHGADV
jgi:hydrogenase maturation protein HypF